MASIYKVFESTGQENYDIKDIFNSKITLIENIILKPASTQPKNESDKFEWNFWNFKKIHILKNYIIILEQNLSVK